MKVKYNWRSVTFSREPDGLYLNGKKVKISKSPYGLTIVRDKEVILSTVNGKGGWTISENLGTITLYTDKEDIVLSSKDGTISLDVVKDYGIPKFILGNGTFIKYGKTRYSDRKLLSPVLVYDLPGVSEILDDCKVLMKLVLDKEYYNMLLDLGGDLICK